MIIRLFDWRDLPALIRYRDHGVYFDNSLVMTRGSFLVPAGALFSYFAPATGIFTYLCSNNVNPGQPIIGQMRHTASSAYTRLTYLAPDLALDSDALQNLLEHMFVQAGERGAFYLVAEVDEQSVAFESLRQAGLAIYARQRVWRLESEPTGETLPTPWRECTQEDIFAVRSLYNDLVPGLVQQVEPSPPDQIHGTVYRQGEEVLAYIEFQYGPRGIWIQPFVHPDAEQVSARLSDLIKNMPIRRSRPVYISVRSYQSWLEKAIEDLGAHPGPSQAVMVKHLVISKKVVRPFTLRTLEGRQPEATAPMARSESKR